MKTALGGEKDIDEMFELLDDDGNGEIDVNKFIFIHEIFFYCFKKKKIFDSINIK